MNEKGVTTRATKVRARLEEWYLVKDPTDATKARIVGTCYGTDRVPEGSSMSGFLVRLDPAEAMPRFAETEGAIFELGKPMPEEKLAKETAIHHHYGGTETGRFRGTGEPNLESVPRERKPFEDGYYKVRITYRDGTREKVVEGNVWAPDGPTAIAWAAANEGMAHAVRKATVEEIPH